MYYFLELKVGLYHQDDAQSPRTKLLNFQANSLECAVVQRTYNTVVDTKLGSISCMHHRDTNSIALINTMSDTREQEYLLRVKFTQVKNHIILHFLFLMHFDIIGEQGVARVSLEIRIVRAKVGFGIHYPSCQLAQGKSTGTDQVRK